MTAEKEDFIEALERYVVEELRASGQPAEYNNSALRVVDARNHHFVAAGIHATDEADDIYALRDLCRPDDATLEMHPDRGRLAAVAHNYFG